MLSIGKLAAGQQHYYLSAVAAGVEDYYLAGGPPGQWLGGGAAELGLRGEVHDEDLTAVLGGNHPRGGNPLSSQARRLPGYDLTFSAPKSVSLLAELSVSAERRWAVVRAHESAVAAALGYLEREAVFVRRGHGGLERVATTGMVGAGFRHHTSRAGDPSLHTHVLVANVARGVDGRWSALDGTALYAHAKTAGYLYKAHLRHELTRTLGVEWTAVHRGMAEIVGFSPQVVRAFSQRRAEIEERLAARGESSARAAQVATLDTRRAKDYGVSPVDLLDEWRERAAALGLDQSQLERVVGHYRFEDRERSVQEITGHLLGTNGLTAHASSFDRRDVIQAWCDAASDGDTVGAIEHRADELLASPSVVQLVGVDDARQSDVIRRADGRVVRAAVAEGRYSTTEMLAVEQRVLDSAIRRQDAGVAVAPQHIVEWVLTARPQLADEQQAMVRQLLASGDGVEVVVGKAGSGKTFALDAVREAWEATGHRVIGATLAARAAAELEAGSGIASTTVAGLLTDLEHRHLRVQNSVVVIDEAAMVGTRTLDRLLAEAETAGAKVVLVGDHHQLGAIDAGGAFRALAARLPTIELTENRRQVAEWEREALDELRAARPERAIAHYAAHGRVTTADTAAQVRDRLVADWWSAVGEFQSAVMLAARRADGADLNARARATMMAAGHLQGDRLEVGGQTFAVGDRVMATRNTRNLGVVNGSLGSVIAIDAEARSLDVRLDTQAVVTLPAWYLEAGHLTHGYAFTVHKAQGMTVDAAFLLGDDRLYRELGYVGLSRASQANHLYVVACEVAPESHVPTRFGLEPVDDLIRGLRRSGQQALALDAHDGDVARLARQRATALFEERDRLARILSAPPLDPGPPLRDAKEQLAGAQAEREDLIDRGARRRRSPLRAQLGNCEARIAAWRARREELEERADTRQQWLAARSGELSRLDLIDRALDHQVRTVVGRAELAPPRYITNLLGPRPDGLAARDTWRHAVAEIETYRQRHGVRDRHRALGPSPRSGDQRQEWRLAWGFLRDAQRHLGLERDVERDLGRSRGMSIGR